MAINQVETVVLLFRLRQLHIVFRDLMPESPASTVNRYHDLTYLANPQRSGRLFIVNVIDLLYLAEVVSRAQAAKLLHTAPHCRLRYSIGISAS